MDSIISPNAHLAALADIEEAVELNCAVPVERKGHSVTQTAGDAIMKDAIIQQQLLHCLQQAVQKLDAQDTALMLQLAQARDAQQNQQLSEELLDVRLRRVVQLAAADAIFADLKKARLKPYNECASDAWRHILDARLLSEVLDITDRETHEAMQRLREMLSDEPSITGTKQTSCCYKKDKKDAASRGVPYDYDDAAEAEALKTQQRRLKKADIWLPKV